MGAFSVKDRCSIPGAQVGGFLQGQCGMEADDTGDDVNEGHVAVEMTEKSQKPSRTAKDICDRIQACT